MNKRKKTQSGQALVLVTVALIAMVGMMGLGVDLGWMFFVKKQAQSAADAAALAAVEEAKLRMGGQFSGFTCPATPGATTPWCDVSGTLECSSGGTDVGTASNLYNGCLYASRNGFSQATNSRQSVWVQAYDSTKPPPGLAFCTGSGTPAPCFDPKSLAYWVNVSIVQTVPQLFSAVLGNTQGTISATGTAAVVSVVVPGQFIATNTPGAWIQGHSKNLIQGQDIDVQGSSSLTVPGGIILDTTCTGATTGCTGVGTTTGGSSSVTSGSSVEIPASGTTTGANVSPAPSVGSSGFGDPYQGTDQPPLIPSNGTVGSCGVLNGNITNPGNTTLVLGPYQYYSYHMSGGNAVVDGNQINLAGNIAFDPNSTLCSGGTNASIVNGSAASGAFSTFYFYGGLSVGTGSTYFGPGEYAMVGLNSQATSSNQLLIMGNSQSTVTGSGTGAGAGVNAPASVPAGVTADTGAGTLFVLTDPSYSAGLGTSTTTLPSGTTGLVGNLGTLSMLAGNASSISLAGLDKGVASVPSDLTQYNGLLLWQDRANSTLDYNSKGYIVSPSKGTVCGSASDCPPNCTTTTTCNPNAPTPSTLDAETIQFQARPNLSLAGVIYQPQGASINIQGHADVSAALQIITGGVVMTGGGSVSLVGVPNPAIKFIVGLVR